MPLLRDVGVGDKGLVANAKESAVARALSDGEIAFSNGVFSGKFSAAISKELRKLGGRWVTTDNTWRLPEASLTQDIRLAISTSEARFQERVTTINKKLVQFLPEKIADNLELGDIFSALIWKTDRNISKTLSGISVLPELSAEGRKRLAAEWSANMNFWITDFTQKEIKRLRQEIIDATYSGKRYDKIVEIIHKSYGVTYGKAKFLARQETSLLVTKLKEVRYTESGIQEYKWGCVAGSKNHPVRPAHKRLEGKVFRWDTPPITSEPDEPVRRNNPGQDFNCRCFARPIVHFKKDTG